MQWAKFFKDTTRTFPAANYYIQGRASDSLSNIFYCYAKNAADTSLSFITKLSPDGQVIWHKSLFPFSMNNVLYNRFDRQYQVHVDSNQHLIIAGALWDTTGYSVNGYYERYLFFKKWDLNGVELAQKMVWLPHPSSQGVTADLVDMKVMPQGTIFLSHYFSDSAQYFCKIYAVDAQFDSVFSYDLLLADSSDKFPIRAPVMAINDTSLTLAYSMGFWPSVPFACRHILHQVDLATADTNWVYFVDETSNFNIPQQLEIAGNSLYVAGNGVERYMLSNGNLLYQNRNQQIHRLVYEPGNARIYGIPIYINNDINVYVYDTSLTLQNVIYPTYMPGFNKILFGIEQRDSVLYCYGANKDANDNNRMVSLEVTRLLQNGTISDVSSMPLLPLFEDFMEYPKPMLDDHGDVVWINVVNTPALPDTGNVFLRSFPIYGCKLAFDTAFNLSGTVYHDTNMNCQQDMSEAGIGNHLIHLMPEDIYTISDSTGYYTFRKANGLATVECIPLLGGVSNCIPAATHSLNVVGSAVIDSLDFGLQSNGNWIDAACKLYAGVSRPGYIQRIQVLAQNLSNQVLTGVQASLTVDTMYNVLSFSLPPDSVVGQTLYWTFDTLGLGEAAKVHLDIIPNPLIGLGYHYEHRLQLFASGDTVLITNNSDTSKGTIVGSFDPNHKLAEPMGIGPFGIIDNDTRLKYTIEFQNTGTDTAFFVRLEDVLDKHLDLGTLRIEGSSHPMHFALKDRTLTFYFNPILLPDSHKNYQQSIGFASYSIKPKSNLIGQQIKNQAAIYFDYNAPVITNTTLHTIGTLRSPLYYEEDQLSAYPIPSGNQSVKVEINVVASGMVSLDLFDLSGRRIHSLFNGYLDTGVYSFRLEREHLARGGIYVMRLITPRLQKSLKLTNL